jgi:acylphosphatase
VHFMTMSPTSSVSPSARMLGVAGTLVVQPKSAAPATLEKINRDRTTQKWLLPIGLLDAATRGSRCIHNDRMAQEARNFLVRGRVQGVGFRYFVEKTAVELQLTGYTRNLDDGRVEVYAVGPPAKLDALNQRLWQGPRFSDVRGVEVEEAPVRSYSSFRIEG